MLNTNENIIINQKKIKQADLVVGIPSYNEADNISFVAEQVDKGITKYFKQHKAVIINIDHNSPDDTRGVFLNTKTKTAKIYISTPPNLPGKGYGFYNLFKFAKNLKPKAIVVVDADLKNISPEWIKNLAEPIFQGIDFITPFYSRCEYDGTITNNICYPLIYGLFGYNIRQPIGGDFSFSPKLLEYWLEQKWSKTTYKFGIDIFMTMNAILGRFKIAQTELGSKIHKPSAPKLDSMFSQVALTLFEIIKDNKKIWLNSNNKKSILNFRNKNIKFQQIQTLSVDYKKIKTKSIFNFYENKNVLAKMLSKDVFKKIKRMYDKKDLDINDELWRKILYDAVYAYDTTNAGGKIVEALKPLYFGRFVSFFKATLDKSPEACEKEIVNQAKLFWNNRNYLIEKYKV
ncbi:MAG: glycosyltransferase [Patescibacteria group bacterium]|nr:glycosyltransferase [Patescibacteria group bacterium]